MAGAERPTQRAVERCESCGGRMVMRPTLSPWEFEGKCAQCGGGVTKSWAHASPAPVFVTEGDGRQGSLFDGS